MSFEMTVIYNQKTIPWHNNVCEVQFVYKHNMYFKVILAHKNSFSAFF
jgi:hypothetical protein